MKQCTLTVDVIVNIDDDVDPNDVTFAGIENAVPQANGRDVGSVSAYVTQQYFEHDPPPDSE